MSSLRTPALRHCLRNHPSVCPYQRRWARVHDVRFLATTPSSERIFEKYKDKLDRKAKEIGVDSINDLKKIYSSPKSPFPPPPPAPAQPTSPSSTSSPTSSPASSSSSAPIKTLSSYLDLPKISTLPTKEISSLWRLRHINDPQSLCAVIPTEIYRKIESMARKHPQFILPIGREAPASQSSDGESPVDAPAGAGAGTAEIHFLQWTFPAPDTVTVLFTHLAEYKLRGEYAQPHTTVTHHLELAEEKGIVLLKGQVTEGRGVSVDDGRWLLMCLQKFYGMEAREERVRLLRQFSDGDSAFRVEDLVSESERTP